MTIRLHKIPQLLHASYFTRVLHPSAHGYYMARVALPMVQRAQAPPHAFSIYLALANAPPIAQAQFPKARRNRPTPASSPVQIGFWVPQNPISNPIFLQSLWCLTAGPKKPQGGPTSCFKSNPLANQKYSTQGTKRLASSCLTCAVKRPQATLMPL